MGKLCESQSTDWKKNKHAFRLNTPLFVFIKLGEIVSTSGLLWWFDEANQVKEFKTMWSYVECMKISWRLKSLV